MRLKRENFKLYSGFNGISMLSNAVSVKQNTDYIVNFDINPAADSELSDILLVSDNLITNKDLGYFIKHVGTDVWHTVYVHFNSGNSNMIDVVLENHLSNEQLYYMAINFKLREAHPII